MKTLKQTLKVLNYKLLKLEVKFGRLANKLF